MCWLEHLMSNGLRRCGREPDLQPEFLLQSRAAALGGATGHPADSGMQWRGGLARWARRHWQLRRGLAPESSGWATVRKVLASYREGYHVWESGGVPV